MEARKGDLILIERKAIITSLTEPRRERTTYEYGVVGSATRDGVVKTWHPLGYGDGLLSVSDSVLPRHARMWVMPRKAIDVEAALRAAKAHHWDGHPNQPKPFDTLEAAKDAIRAYVIKSAA